MTQARRALGAAGENIACAHLIERGYRILARNARPGGVELDIVARRGSSLIFVEVKTRSSRHQGPAIVAVDARKQRRLIQGAYAWLGEHRSRASRVRFDVIGVERDADGSWLVTHLEGAFDAGDTR